MTSFYYKDVMKPKEELLGYCGLYCGDCAGFSGEIAITSKRLKDLIFKYKFNRTAKELFNGKLREFDKFEKMLQLMTELKCPQICRERGTPEGSCEIKRCCREHGYFACYECEDFTGCEKLKSLEPLHGDSCIKNLVAIKKLGINKWITQEKRLWFGSDIDD